MLRIPHFIRIDRPRGGAGGMPETGRAKSKSWKVSPPAAPPPRHPPPPAPPPLSPFSLTHMRSLPSFLPKTHFSLAHPPTHRQLISLALVRARMPGFDALGTEYSERGREKERERERERENARAGPAQLRRPEPPRRLRPAAAAAGSGAAAGGGRGPYLRPAGGDRRLNSNSDQWRPRGRWLGLVTADA